MNLQKYKEQVTKRITICISEATHKDLLAVAKKYRLPKGVIARVAIEEVLQRELEKPKASRRGGK